MAAGCAGCVTEAELLPCVQYIDIEIARVGGCLMIIAHVVIKHSHACSSNQESWFRFSVTRCWPFITLFFNFTTKMVCMYIKEVLNLCL